MLRLLNPLPIFLLAAPVLLVPAVSVAQLVPGTGTLVNVDDFEKPGFEFDHKWPKSSKEEDEQVRYPLGHSNTGMWLESPKRGAPDSIKVVETPLGGLPGSSSALYLRTRDTGIPNRPGFKQAQDDLIMKARPMSVSASPNCVVRVYLPEWDQWEQRMGVSFGLRCGMQGPKEKVKESGIRRLFRNISRKTVTEMEPFYPGFFIQYVPGTEPSNKSGRPYAVLLLRADELGHEMQGPVITETGWWTLGISVTPDSRVHYYAKPGVGELTQADYIRSSIPYGIRGTHFNTIFFNICSGDNGQSWSTPWIIDDPKVFAGRGNYGPAVQEARRR